MNSGIALIFPGQGAQYRGMGKEFVEQNDFAKRFFAEAEEVTNIPVRELCMDAPKEMLAKTSVLQPCLTVVDVICGFAIRNAGVEPSAVAGHSLGEYPALWMAGILEFPDVMRLVKMRGELMENAGGNTSGGMAAVIGLERDVLEREVNTLVDKGLISLANHNSREQIVVTGEKELVSTLCKVVKRIGARAVPLKVSGAFHSEMMRPAAEKFAALLDEIEFKKPDCPLFCNVSAMPETEPGRIRELMKEQMCAPVRWFEIVNGMYDYGIRTFVEAGPRRVLSGLVKKSLDFPDKVKIFQADNPQSLDEVVAELFGQEGTVQ